MENQKQTAKPAVNQQAKSPTVKSAVLELEDKFIQIANEIESPVKFAKESIYAIQAINSSDMLKKCSVNSIQKSIINLALTGLTLDPNLSFCYLVPRGNEAVLDISYRGMIKIVTDRLKVRSINANVIYENDTYDYEYGTNQYLKHKPVLKDRGDMIAVYAIAVLDSGEEIFTILTSEDVEAIRETSKSQKSAYSPWNTFTAEMWKKSAIKRLFKILPKPDKIEQATEVISIDNDNGQHDFKNKPKSNVADLFAADDAEIIE